MSRSDKPGSLHALKLISNVWWRFTTCSAVIDDGSAEWTEYFRSNFTLPPPPQPTFCAGMARWIACLACHPRDSATHSGRPPRELLPCILDGSRCCEGGTWGRHPARGGREWIGQVSPPIPPGGTPVGDPQPPDREPATPVTYPLLPGISTHFYRTVFSPPPASSPHA